MSDLRTRRTLAENTVPLIMRIVGAVLTVAGLALFLLWRKGLSAAAVQQRPARGARDAGDHGTEPATKARRSSLTHPARPRRPSRRWFNGGPHSADPSAPDPAPGGNTS